MGEQVRTFLRKNKHMAIVLYFPFYMAWFEWLEHRKNVHHQMIECALDHKIPFCELFAIPYFMWFGYVAIGLLLLFLHRKYQGEFYRCAAILMLGMTTALIVYTLLPNAQPLRPAAMPRDNALTRLIAGLYQTDTPTNVCPSIHVYNSLCIQIALTRSYLPEAFFCYDKENTVPVSPFRKRATGLLLIAGLVLCVLICLSTMFLKQHSVIDVVCALVMYGVYYVVVYRVL